MEYTEGCDGSCKIFARDVNWSQKLVVSAILEQFGNVL
jgi:hypothetical protein